MSTATPSLEKLQRAVSIAEQIQKLEKELASIFGDKVSSKSPGSVIATEKKSRRGKRMLSPEARERIAAAQRARWAKSKGAAAAAPGAEVPKSVAKKEKTKKRRKISPEAREKMAAAAKRRWAKVKA